jgi:hypothetical protein
MGARATGLTPRRGYQLDALTTLVGYIAAGPRNRAAQTLTGAAQLLTTQLGMQDVFKVVCYGQSTDAAGGYLIQAAHVAEGAALASATGWTTIATITASAGNIQEIALSGASIMQAVKTTGSITGDVRVVAVRATAGTGANGVAVPAGTMNIGFQTDMS